MFKGWDEEVVEVVYKVVKWNGRILFFIFEDFWVFEFEGYCVDIGVVMVIKWNFEKLDIKNVWVFFSMCKLVFSIGFIMVVWVLIGFGFLFYNVFLLYI